ncbi:MAG: hypothetical protein WBA45_05010 [Microthrixaceae bacterium]
MNPSQQTLVRHGSPIVSIVLAAVFVIGLCAPVGAAPPHQEKVRAAAGTTVERIFYQRFSSTKWQPENCPSDARYHTNYGCVSADNNLSLATLHSANPDGSDEQAIEIGCTGGLALWLAPNQGVIKTAIDSTNGKIYWENDFEPAIARSDLDGSNCEMVANGGYYGKVSIAIDGAGKHLYSVQHSTLRRVDTETGTVTNLTFTGLGSFVPTSFTDITVSGDTLYASLNNVGSQGHIMAVTLDSASTALEASLLVSGPPGATSVAVDSVNDKIYWATGSSVKRADVSDGTNVETIATGAYSFAVPSPTLDSLVMGNRSGALMVTADLDGQNAETTTMTSAVIPTIGAVPSSISPQVVTWSPTTALTTSQSPFTPSAATTSGDGAITYSVTSAGTTGCTVDGTTGSLTFTAAGECQVRATAAATSDYSEATSDATFVITTATTPTTTTTPPTTTPTTVPSTTSPGTPAPSPADPTSAAPLTPAGTSNGGSPTGATFGDDSSSIVGNRSINQGGTVTVSGWGFAPGSSVAVWMHSSPTLLTTVTAGADGRVSATVTVPKDAQLGAHEMKLVGQDTDGQPLTLSLALDVTPIGQLAFTGGDSSPLLAAGLALIVAGALLSEFTRRRRLA